MYRKQSVFLPQVASEQGWTLLEILMHLSLKAGLAEDAYKRKDAVFEVFKSRGVFRDGKKIAF